MLIATQNVRGTPNLNDVDTIHDVTLTASQAEIVGWQEMQHPNHQRALAKLPAPWQTYVAPRSDGSPSGQAISWNGSLYRAVEREPGVIGHSHLLTNVVPNCSDERRVAVVILEEIATGRRFVVASTHFPPKNKPGMVARAEYARGVERLQRLIVAWYAHDLPFVLLMDANRTSLSRPLGQNIAGHHLFYRGSPLSIDLIITGDSSKLAWDAAGVATLGGRRSDHKCRRLNATLKKIVKPVQPPARPDAPTDVESVLAAAKSQVGYHEGFSNGHWNNQEKFAPQVPGLEWAQGQAWCDVFVCWCFQKAGLRSLLPVVSASCDISASAWKKAGRWSEYPAIGAQIFFGTPSDLNHTGLVHDYDDTYVYTYEGNTNTSGSREGDGVYAKRHLRRDARIVGYGYPKFAQPIKSADPAWKGRR